jgi:thiamine pyrophosphokinase
MQNLLLNEELEDERVDIGGFEYSFKDRKFKLHELFITSNVTYCQSCDLEFS